MNEMTAQDKAEYISSDSPVEDEGRVITAEDFFQDGADYMLTQPGSLEADEERSAALHKIITDLMGDLRFMAQRGGNVNTALMVSINLRKIGEHVLANLEANGVYFKDGHLRVRDEK